MKYSWQVKLAARLCGIIVLIYILMGIDIQTLLIITFGIPPLLTFLLVLFVLPIMLTRAMRWKVIAEGLDLNLKTLDAAEALCLSHSANLVVPGSVGDLVRIPFMTHRGNRMDRSIISILLDSVLGSIVPFTAGVLAIAV
ncbi:MAG: flippase-like domain-containing protein, partial [Candidatus Thorarchaeota archaeon]|nr:flippase-like domain-containing protein [Candidatus Thorarchaeota archaeon]